MQPTLFLKAVLSFLGFLTEIPFACLFSLLVTHPHFFFVALRPNAGHGLLILEVSRSHTTTHHSRWDSSGRVISSSRRPPPDKTQHPQQADIHASAGIRTYNPSN